jgi:hypothetical protein
MGQVPWLRVATVGLTVTGTGGTEEAVEVDKQDKLSESEWFMRVRVRQQIYQN